jgi:hypothetical protein
VTSKMQMANKFAGKIHLWYCMGVLSRAGRIVCIIGSPLTDLIYFLCFGARKRTSQASHTTWMSLSQGSLVTWMTLNRSCEMARAARSILGTCIYLGGPSQE